MRLPARLQATLDLVPLGTWAVADVGSGHGALAVALAERGMRVVATERTEGSFAALERDLQKLTPAGAPRLETRCGDGLSALVEGEVDVAVIAGLGGRSLIRILETAPWLPRWLVLQPVQDAHLVADWLASRGWEPRESRIAQARRWYLAWLVEVPATARPRAV